MADKPYRDPKTTKIEDWPWRPLEQVADKLSLREVPDYIQKGFGEFMNRQSGRAQRGEMTPRDLIKAYTIAQSSIGRGGLSHATATKTGMRLPNTGDEVRPEGAFAEWLGSPEGQRYLDAAESGITDDASIADLQGKFAPFGKQNDQAAKMMLAVKMAHLMAPNLNKALTGSTDDYRDYAEQMKGIAGAKSGFIGSLLGRGDLPTLDARQLNLHALPAAVGVNSIMNRGKGKGAREAVDRLASRQKAMGFLIDPSLQPHYQHLAHHAVWDKASGTQTTHDDLMRAMNSYADGGSTTDLDAMKLALMNKAKLLEGSHTQMRLYHGTTATEGGKGKEAIRRLKQSKEGALGSGAYLTPNPDFAGEYAQQSGGNVLPVHARITNPLVLTGETHRDPMVEALVKLGMTPEKASDMVEKAYEKNGYIGKQVQQRAQAAGHDALMQYRDGKLSEVVHYNPRMIKSAIGNRGTYDTSVDDLSMADGGEVEPVRITLKSADNSASKRMIDDVYSKYPAHPFNARQRAVVEGEGEDQTLGTFELKPSMSARNAVELSWLSAYPHKQGVGSRTLKKLQEHATEHNVGLTLFPWEHGGVSQSKLMKFYKKHGFAPAVKGGKNMIWRPEEKAKGGTVKDYITITERPL